MFVVAVLSVLVSAVVFSVAREREENPPPRGARRRRWWS
jgi:hypothetical protein